MCIHIFRLQQILREAGGSFNSEDCSKFTKIANVKKWKEEKSIESIRDRFVTGDWSKAAQRQRGQVSDVNGVDDDEVYGDIEDLETGEKYEGGQAGNDGSVVIPKEDDSAIEERRLKKLALRAKFDSQYPSLGVVFEYDISPSLFYFCFFFFF